MLRSAAVAIIKRGLGFRQTQDTAIVSALQQAQRDLEAGKTLPSWLVVFDAPIVVAANAATAALPTGFLRVHEDYPLYYVNSDAKRINIPKKHHAESWDAYGNDETIEGPKVWVQRSTTTMEIVPVRSTGFTAYLTYYKAADVLDTDMENAWLAHAPNYLAGMAGMVVAGDLRDAGAMQKFTAMAKLGGQGYMAGIIDDELAGRPLMMGRNN